MTVCELCKGRGYRSRYVHGVGWTTETCGRCYGSRQEPVVSLRELRNANQDRIRRERHGNG